MEFNNEKKNINFINNIIIQAIIHGGDSGGLIVVMKKNYITQ